MNTQWIKKHQPSLYQYLTKASTKNRLAHAYLLVGNKDLKEISSWIAAFMMDSNNTDKQLQNNNQNGSLDLKIFDGTETSIKKDEIANLIHEFSQSAIETTQHKVAILHHVDNATTEAMNSLLKMIEEPHPDTTFIMTTNHLHKVLPTIQSRCVVLSMENIGTEPLIQTFIEAGIEELSARYLTTMTSHVDIAIDLNKQLNLEELSPIVYDFISNLTSNFDIASVTLQRQIPNNRNSLTHLFELMKLAMMKEQYSPNIVEVVLDTLTKMTRSVNLPLLVDQFLWHLREEIQ